MKQISKRSGRTRTSAILFVAQDVGGFNACWPVFFALRREKLNVHGVFSSLNRKKAKGARIDFFEHVHESKQAFGQMLDKKRPDVIFVGTSVGLSADKRVICEARVRGIPTVAIVDYWGNAHVRFSTPGTKDRAFVPDWILVPDEICRQQLKKDGFDIRNVVVTGNPHFDQFFRRGVARKEKRTCRRVSFFSQPFSEIIKTNPEANIGLDERDIFRDVLAMLHEVDETIPISVVFHPREKMRSKYNSSIKNSGMRVRLEGKKNATQMIHISAFVIGMNTMALVEAALSGVSAISYQPHLKREDPLITNHFGLTHAAYDQEACIGLVRRCLQQEGNKVLPYYARKLADGQATKRVLAFLRLHHWI